MSESLELRELAVTMSISPTATEGEEQYSYDDHNSHDNYHDDDDVDMATPRTKYQRGHVKRPNPDVPFDPWGSCTAQQGPRARCGASVVTPN